MAGPVVEDEPVAEDELAVGEQVTDDELTALALAANPDEPVPEDAVSMWDLAPEDGADLLPDWYMPAPSMGTRSFRGWRRWLILLIVVVFVALEAYGLCSTYGQVTLGSLVGLFYEPR